jgi:hypothetical protein
MEKDEETNKYKLKTEFRRWINDEEVLNSDEFGKDNSTPNVFLNGHSKGHNGKMGGDSSYEDDSDGRSMNSL